jgi:Alternative complex III, ActD subunit
MTEKITLLAVFADIDPAAHGIDRLRELGVEDAEMNVISGIPVTEAMLGRPRKWSNVPRLALGGAIAGFLVGLTLAYITPWSYPINVGDQGIFPGPPSIVVIFEMTMLGMLIATFLGVFLDSYFPSYTPMEYVPEISDGKIAVLFACPAEAEVRFSQAMSDIGAESVKPAQAVHL